MLGSFVGFLSFLWVYFLTGCLGVGRKLLSREGWDCGKVLEAS